MQMQKILKFQSIILANNTYLLNLTPLLTFLTIDHLRLFMWSILYYKTML